MRMQERYEKLRDWTFDTVCAGRQMKTPAAGMRADTVRKQEPRVYIGFFPTRPDETGRLPEDPLNTAPAILLMPDSGRLKYMEEKRFDRYNHIRRPSQLGQEVHVQALFSVYEDGVRLPGFAADAQAGAPYPMDRVMEGTEEGLFTLFNWMDDYAEALLGANFIPGTDMFLDEESVTWGLYSDQQYVSDRRPMFYGLMTFRFNAYATEKPNAEINQLLE